MNGSFFGMSSAKSGEGWSYVCYPSIQTKPYLMQSSNWHTGRNPLSQSPTLTAANCRPQPMTLMIPLTSPSQPIIDSTHSHFLRSQEHTLLQIAHTLPHIADISLMFGTRLSAHHLLSLLNQCKLLTWSAGNSAIASLIEEMRLRNVHQIKEEGYLWSRE